MKNKYLIYIKISDNNKTYNIDIVTLSKDSKNMKEAIDSVIQDNAEFLKDKKWSIFSISKIDNSVNINDFRSKEE